MVSPSQAVVHLNGLALRIFQVEWLLIEYVQQVRNRSIRDGG